MEYMRTIESSWNRIILSNGGPNEVSYRSLDYKWKFKLTECTFIDLKIFIQNQSNK